MVDEKWMEECLRLALKGKGWTSPNPMVGAVIVKDGELIAKGYHKRFGEDHAERIALKRAGRRAEGATLYVNLEPCVHYGHTPPCVDFIIEKGIKRVVIATKDPNPIVNGRGIRRLRAKGIEVKTGVLKREAILLNEVYFKYIRRRIPFVTLKLGCSLDGKISSPYKRWITSKESRVYAHKLRSYSDAILVGIETIIKDNPRLTTRLWKGKNPVRVILDSHLRIDKDARVLKEKGKTIIFSSKGGEIKGAEVIKIREKDGLLWRDILKELGKREIASLLIEGGARIASSALNAGIVDKILLFYAPEFLGEGLSFTQNLLKPIRLKSYRLEKIGKDILLEGYVYRTD